MDLHAGFLQAVKEVLGHAEVAADRFHVAKLYREGADHLRKQELKRRKRELPKAEYATLKGAMWALRKNPADLEGPEHEVLKRRCHGIVNLSHLFQRISLDLEGYRLFANPVG